MLILQLLVMLVVATGPQVSANTGHRRLAVVWNTLFNIPVANRQRNCAGGCGARRAAMEHSVPNSQLKALRIEFIKQQILNKLRLKEPPNVTMPLSSLPLPLTNRTVLSITKEQSPPNDEVDDYYGKTDQVILFPQEGDVRCIPTTNNPSACFPFQLPAELVSEDVTTAELWIYKEKDRSGGTNHTFVISEAAGLDLNRSSQKTKHIATHSTRTAGWVKIDLLWPIRNWLDFQELYHAIRIECPTCTTGVDKFPISLQSEHKPFLVINTNSVSEKPRLKRKLNCLPGVTECCRENLYISFADIGWEDWILHPSGYQAFFCRGSCSSAASLTVSGTYRSIVRKLLHQSSASTRLELVPCCTATHLSSIQLLYVDNNNTITQKTLPNMVVDSCGCM